MIELQAIHIILGLLGSFMGILGTTWAVFIRPLFKSIREGDVWRTNKDNEIKMLKNDLEHLEEKQSGIVRTLEKLTTKVDGISVTLTNIQSTLSRLDERSKQ